MSKIQNFSYLVPLGYWWVHWHAVCSVWQFLLRLRRVPGSRKLLLRREKNTYSVVKQMENQNLWWYGEKMAKPCNKVEASWSLPWIQWIIKTEVTTSAWQLTKVALKKGRWTSLFNVSMSMHKSNLWVYSRTLPPQSQLSPTPCYLQRNPILLGNEPLAEPSLFLASLESLR